MERRAGEYNLGLQISECLDLPAALKSLQSCLDPMRRYGTMPIQKLCEFPSVGSWKTWRNPKPKRFQTATIPIFQG